MFAPVDERARGGNGRPMHERSPLGTLSLGKQSLKTRSGVCSRGARSPGTRSRGAVGVGSLSPLFLVAVVLSCFFFTEDAKAYAWMIRHDYTACSTCHADPSGGELLTQYGRVTSDLILRMHYGDGAKEGDGDKKAEAKAGEKEGPDTGVLWGALDLPDRLLLSGSYRNLYVISPSASKAFTFIPVMQADLYGQLRLGPMTFGGSLGAGRVNPGSTHTRAAQVTSSDDGMVLVARNFYVGADLGDKVVLRGGRLNLPFGVRIPEHTMWAREVTKTDRESDQQDGLALAYVGENLRAEFMGIAGNYQTRLNPLPPYEELSSDAVRERGYSFYMEGIAGTSFAAGISSKVTYARLDRQTFEEKTLQQAHGLTMRWAPFRRFSFLGEMNSLFRSNHNAGYVGFLQADYEPIQGLHFLATGEILDEGMPVVAQGEPTPIAGPGAGLPKGGGWISLDWFFYRQLEFRTDLVLRQNEPVTVLGQLHFYL